MKFVVIFARTFEDARQRARERKLLPRRWLYASDSRRLDGLAPEDCETVVVPGYSTSIDASRAFDFWQERLKRRTDKA